MIFKNILNIKQIYLLLFIFDFIEMSKSEKQPEISINDIKVTGIWLKTQNGKEIMTFLGIPYAKPPIEELRFTDPQPYGKLKNNFEATTDSPFCPQLSNTNISISEDCLYLNIYTKTSKTKNPVIFFIHGGAFMIGGGQNSVYGPEYLLDNDLVLVTFNYRLGPFGFLSTKTNDATGNYGLKDQVLALKWVRDNIKYFGGDPNSITLFGQSAGAWSVSAHLVSPMSKDLFHKAIAFSGSTTSAYHIDNFKWSRILAKELNCTTKNATKMIKCLRNISWENLIAAADYRIGGHSILSFNIEIEEDFGQKERFLTEHPSVSISKGNFNKVPILTGTTRDEFDEFAHVLINMKLILLLMNENFEVIAPTIFAYEAGTAQSTEISEKFKKFYFKNEEISKHNVKNLSQIFSDSIIIHSVHRLMQLARKHVDVYFYRFDFKGRFSCGSKDNNQVPNFISHTDDLTYLFVLKHCAPLYEKTDPENFMVERLNRWIYNFVKTGNPNGIQNIVNEADCPTWPRSDKDTVKTLFNDVKCVVKDEEPYLKRMKMWDEIFPVESKSSHSSADYFFFLLTFCLIFLIFV